MRLSTRLATFLAAVAVLTSSSEDGGPDTPSIRVTQSPTLSGEVNTIMPSTMFLECRVGGEPRRNDSLQFECPMREQLVANVDGSGTEITRVGARSWRSLPIVQVNTGLVLPLGWTTRHRSPSWRPVP